MRVETRNENCMHWDCMLLSSLNIEGVTQAVTIESNLTRLLPQRQGELHINFSHIHTP